MANEISVCAAVILREDRLFLATRRPGSHLEGKWEFPGGKVAVGETREECITRELQEELGVTVTRATPLFTLPFDYPGKQILLHFLACEITGDPVGKEQQQCGWFSPRDLPLQKLVPADEEALKELAHLPPYQEWFSRTRS